MISARAKAIEKLRLMLGDKPHKFSVSDVEAWMRQLGLVVVEPALIEAERVRRTELAARDDFDSEGYGAEIIDAVLEQTGPRS